MPPTPSADVLALIPPWARAAVVMIPALGLGGAGGYLGGGQAAANADKERAVLTARQAATDARVAQIEAVLDKIDSKIDRLIERSLP